MRPSFSQSVVSGSKTPVRLTRHAAARLQLRVRPGLDNAGILADFQHLQQQGEIVSTPPSWLSSGRPCDSFLVLGDIALPLFNRGAEFLATTALTRGGLSGGARQRRSERRSRLCQPGRRQPDLPLSRSCRRAEVAAAIAASLAEWGVDL